MTQEGRGPSEPAALTKAQQDLVAEHLWLAEQLAEEYRWLRPKTLDGDLAGPAEDGLIQAARGYDSARGSFGAYAYRFVVGAILDAAKAKAPAFVQAARAGLEQVTELLDEPAAVSVEDAAEDLEWTGASMCVGSASLAWAGRDPRSEERPAGAASQLAAALTGFTDAERAVLLHRYGLGETWEATAEAAGISVRSAKRWGPKLRAVVENRLRSARPFPQTLPPPSADAFPSLRVAPSPPVHRPMRRILPENALDEPPKSLRDAALPPQGGPQESPRHSNVRQT